VTARTPAQRRIAGFVLLALVAGASSACITRTVRETVVDDGFTAVILRSQEKGGELIDKGFEHPITIAPVRLAHILSRIDLRRENDKEAKRVPAIHLDSLFTIADGIAQGLQKADSSQEIVVQSIRRSKRLGVFDRHYLTSLLCYMRDDLLYIHISRSDWEVRVQRDDRLPETHVGKYPLKFRLVVEKGMMLVDHQAVAAEWRDPIFRKPTRTRITPGGKVVRRTILMEREWRDPIFRKPTRTRITPGGKVVRRTILMESFEDETDYGPRPQMSDDLSPEQLRALADLEEQRRSGNISEGQYNARRNRILRGEAEAP
jgi:hypothetical protein